MVADADDDVDAAQKTVSCKIWYSHHMFDGKEVESFWRERSREDFDTAQSLVGLGKNTYALFFCHLAIEKLLKALVVRKTQQNAPYDHNLQRLASDASLSLDTKTQEDIADINTFNIKGRYDDFKSNFYTKATSEYTQRYVRETERILLWLREQ